MKKLINVMIENEFHKIQEFKENDDLKDNKEYQEDFDKCMKLFEKLLSSGLYKNQRDLLYQYDETLTDWAVDLAQYYFKQGIIAAFNELECLKDYSEVL